MYGPFPKIFALGTQHTERIFHGPVEITEKIDGSQFGFGKVDGQLFCRSKGVGLNLDDPTAMFVNGVNYVKEIERKIPDNFVFYGEYLQTPKHNVLAYNSTPRNGIALFGGVNIANHQKQLDANTLRIYADAFKLDVVPIIWEGEVSGDADVKEFIKGLLQRESYLGGPHIEGVVIKNYAESTMIGGHVVPLLAAKFVSEAFKEVHGNTAYGDRSKYDILRENYRSIPRWQKAVQHMRERGELTDSPKDIGQLIIDIKKDIGEECKEEIKERLWKIFQRDIIGYATKGFPEWYKEQLLENLQME